MTGANPYSMFSTDATSEVNGIDLDFGPFKITVARAGGRNLAFSRVMRAKMKPFKYQIEQGTLDDGVARCLMAEAYAETVIKGWAPFVGADGKPQEFNQSNVVKTLLDLPDLFDEVQRQSSLMSNFRATEAEEAAEVLKNS